MDIPATLDLGAQRVHRILDPLMLPALMPLPSIPVSAEVWHEERHLCVRGEAIYAVHRGSRAWWAVVVRDSRTVAPGCVHLVELSEVRCESASGRRGV